MPRSTRRTKENLANPTSSAQRDNGTATSGKKARHRLSTEELARLEDVFMQETHPSRQQKKELAAQLGMDYKTVTIWFQNKRQTSKRGQQLPLESGSRRLKTDSCLRTVSSPSHNATLDASDSIVPKGNSMAIIKIKPLLDSLNALTSRYSESRTQNGTPNAKDADTHWPQILTAETATISDKHDQTVQQEQIKECAKPIKWKKVRTLEWACERQAKRRKLSRDGPARLGPEEVQDGDPNDTRMDTASSLLSLASSTQTCLPKDVMKGASLLLSLKHSWHKQQQIDLEATSS